MALTVSGIAAVLGISASVLDVSRSAMYALPAAFVGLALLPRGWGLIRPIMLSAAAASVLTPTYLVVGKVLTLNGLPLPIEAIHYVKAL